ncbi:hypothetical protein RHMOL_Rhmol13G0279200 [Rhododendron molle]|uniref:Uncharacterized protein n=1 Tax=Rhododendron molle TaxID=49168 RepID=A0ACC0LBX0_RHOML|nr:hypothetical protein RHMOL_Rhmol13G0279200 [Rhododendron molle]
MVVAFSSALYLTFGNRDGNKDKAWIYALSSGCANIHTNLFFRLPTIPPPSRSHGVHILPTNFRQTSVD